MAILLLLPLLLLSATTAQALPLLCGDSGNYTANSTYQHNLQLLASTLPVKASSNAAFFATDTAGAGVTTTADDTVYALALCRGDTINGGATACRDCVTTAFVDASQVCPYSKDAFMYYDKCMLRFSDINFLATINNSVVFLLMNSENFNTSMTDSLLTIINKTADSAAANNSTRLATSTLQPAADSNNPVLYCLVQCTLDLTAADCAACVQNFAQLTIKYLVKKRGGRLIGLRCNMRYEVYQFYQGDPTLTLKNVIQIVPDSNSSSAPNVTVIQYPMPPAPTPAALPPAEGQSPSKLWIVALAVPLLLLCLTFSIAWMRRRRRAANLQDRNPKEEDALVWKLEEKSSEFTLFEFSEILEATANFSEQNLLGQGGFGPVYKGQLADEQEIAVKRLASHSGQGFTEFKNEIELIAKLQHNNLVRLLGCCIKGVEKILVYEYLPNKSLDFFIFDEKKRAMLDWNKRRAIIEGIAQGLLYLHKHSRLRIIHRDLKASNILLDQDMNPKISDFGLAKIFSSNDTQGSTRRVVGTYGYMSPEYASEGIYSIKSDVFSFGVLLLEILSGKRNSGFHQYGDFLNLLGYSWHLWQEGRWIELLEASISEEVNHTDAKKYINMALLCVQESADDRPTMSDVVAMLNSERDVLPYPDHPAYFNLRVSKEEYESAAATIELCSVNGVTITVEADGR